MKNVIYAQVKKDEEKVVYVGQTKNLEYRDKQHREYDPFNINNKEYNYPLSRGIRKQGQEAYKLIILEEDVPSEKLDERERYWIRYYDTYFHGYNQTLGGKNPTHPTMSEEVIDLIIDMLRDENNSYNDIVQKTGASLTHIYNINIGARRKRDDLTYPIRSSRAKGTKGIKLTEEESRQIHFEIINSTIPLSQIAKKHNITAETVRHMNKGLIKAYHYDDFVYPLRKTR